MYSSPFSSVSGQLPQTVRDMRGGPPDYKRPTSWNASSELGKSTLDVLINLWMRGRRLDDEERMRARDGGVGALSNIIRADGAYWDSPTFLRPKYEPHFWNRVVWDAATKLIREFGIERAYKLAKLNMDNVRLPEFTVNTAGELHSTGIRPTVYNTSSSVNKVDVALLSAHENLISSNEPGYGILPSVFNAPSMQDRIRSERAERGDDSYLTFAYPFLQFLNESDPRGRPPTITINPSGTSEFQIGENSFLNRVTQILTAAKFFDRIRTNRDELRYVKNAIRKAMGEGTLEGVADLEVESILGGISDVDQ